VCGVENEQKQPEMVIQTGLLSARVVWQPRELNVYAVTEEELDNLSEIGVSSSLYVGLTSFCLAALLSLLITILTVKLDTAMFAVFVAVDIAVAILSVYFGIKWSRSARRGSKAKERIKGKG